MAAPIAFSSSVLPSGRRCAWTAATGRRRRARRAHSWRSPRAMGAAWACTPGKARTAIHSQSPILVSPECARTDRARQHSRVTAGSTRRSGDGRPQVPRRVRAGEGRAVRDGRNRRGQALFEPGRGQAGRRRLRRGGRPCSGRPLAVLCPVSRRRPGPRPSSHKPRAWSRRARRRRPWLAPGPCGRPCLRPPTSAWEEARPSAPGHERPHGSMIPGEPESSTRPPSRTIRPEVTE